MPVSDVLSLEPRIIILLRYAIRASLVLPKIVAFPVVLIYILFAVITLPLLIREWVTLGDIIYAIAFHFNFEHRIWVRTFRIIVRPKSLMLISPQISLASKVLL
jgi:hypothetical protein